MKEESLTGQLAVTETAPRPRDMPILQSGETRFRHIYVYKTVDTNVTGTFRMFRII